MSKILKGLNEVNPNNYDSDWDYQDAVAKSGRSRSSYRSQEDDTSDADIAYSKKMYQLGQKQKAAKEKAQRDNDHDRLASGTNEGMMPIGGNSTSTDRRKVMDLLQVYYKSMGGDFWEWFNQPGNKEFFAKRAEVSPDSAYEVVDSIDWGQHPQEEWPEDEEDMKEGLDNPWGDQGNFAGDKPVNVGGVSIKTIQTGDTVKYLGQPSKVVAMSKDRKYSRITISKGMGTVTQDVLTSDLQQLGQGVREEQLDELSNKKLVTRNVTERKIDIDPSSVSPGAPTSAVATATDTTAAPAGQASAAPEGSPVQQVQQLVQQLSPESKKRLIKKLKTELGIVSEEQLDELSNKKLGKYKTAAGADASKADSEGDYKRGDKRMSGIIKATKKEFDNDKKKSNISQGMAEADEKPADPFKSTYPRVNNPKILGTQNRAKTAYYPPSKPNVKKLDKPLPENLGNELKSKSLEALQQVKQKLEQQRMAELEQWEQDFKQNTVSKFTAREPNLNQRATSTPMVAMPGEKHSDLKTRLGQLNKAIEKQGILDKMVQRLDKKGLLTPNIEAGVDTSMLARDGARDNYVELNKKLDKALEYVKNRLLTNKAAYAKPKAIDEEQLDELKCWSGYHRVAGTKAGFPGSCAKNKTNEEDVAEGASGIEQKIIKLYKQGLSDDEIASRLKIDSDDVKSVLDDYEWVADTTGELKGVAEEQHSCPHCGGEMVSEELMNEKKDACYYKVKSRYKVWPSAYASGALVKCRNKGASNWGNGGKKNESSILEGIEQADESLHDWFNKEKWVRMDTKGKIKGPCAREPGEGKPKCLPQSKAHSLGKKGRASAAQRKRREDPNPERSGKAINVDTKKSKG